MQNLDIRETGDRGQAVPCLLFDTHCHYDDRAYDTDREEVIEEIRKAGVRHFVNISADLPSVDNTLRLLDKYPEAFGALGIHPSDVRDLDNEKLSVIREKALSNKRIVAIGEIGLDYHYEEGSPDPEVQKYWFDRELSLARELDLPVVIHSRDAVQDTFDILKNARAEDMGGVIHCFSASSEMAEEYVKMGFYIGIGGVITFKNAKKLVSVVEKTPLSRIVLETDCPYLAPTPHRGERNHSGYLHLVAERIAEIKGVTKDEVIKTTYANAFKMYRIEEETYESP